MNRSFLVGAFALLVLSACSDGNGDAPSDAQSDDRVEASVTDTNTPPADVPADEAPVTDTGSALEDRSVPLPDVPAPEDVASLDGTTPEDVAPPDAASEPDGMMALVDVTTSPDSAPADTGSMIIDAGCERAQCGVTCFSPAVCGACGNGVCDMGESMSDCAADCCNATLCNPAMGSPSPAGDARCAGAPDGTLCDDGDTQNGAETCRGGRCLHEHVHCRCPAPSSTTPTSPGTWMLPTTPPDPAWVGPMPTEASFAQSWGLRRMDTSRAWQSTRGRAEVRVAIVDTGCNAALPDLMGQVVGQRDLVDNDDTAQDVTGHGTALAALVAAREDGTGTVGVAPGARLLCARVTDDRGTATYAHLAAGIQWAVAQGASVILVGVGGISGSSIVDSAVATATRAGIPVVAPAGSTGGSNLDMVPARHADVISVAASDRNDLPTRDTDFGPRTSLLAPGEQIVSVTLAGGLEARDGSSAAAAYVAGVVALVRSAAMSLTPAEVRGLLHHTGDTPGVTDFDRVFVARRVNAGSAVTAAARTLSDVAIGRATFVAPSGLPGEPLRARVNVENRGVTELRNITLRASAASGTVQSAGVSPASAITVSIASLGVGESREVELDVTPARGQTSAGLTVNASVTGDGVAGNDSATFTRPVSDRVVHRVRIERADVTSVSTTAGYGFEAVVENAGNAPEQATSLRATMFPGEMSATVAVPPLAPGERARLNVTLPPPTTSTAVRATAGLYVVPVRGQGDLQSNLASLRFVHSATATDAQTAYFQLPGDNLIADAPWRTVRGRIPLLVFYARLQWTETVATRAGPVEIPYAYYVDSVLVRNPSGPATGAGPVVYEDHADWSAPTSPGAPSLLTQLAVRDEDGNAVTSQKVLPTATPRDGTHRILWFPTGALPNTSSGSMPDPATRGAFLEVDFRYWQRDVLIAFAQRTRKMLGVEVGAAPPDLSSGSRTDRYFDAHFHSIAEWYTGDDLSGPAKAYGGPLQMVLATAWSLGYADASWPPTWAANTNRIITTDHNTYFGDTEAPQAGPTQVSAWPGASGTTGSQEMNIYRAMVGQTAGEEVSLEGSGDLGPRGRHALHYNSDRHVQGAWGTIRLFGSSLTGCTPTYRAFLSGMSDHAATGCNGQSLQGIGGFTFAAHPFADSFVWDPDLMLEALSLPGSTAHNNHQFVRPLSSSDPDGEFVFRGYQFWNARSAETVAAGFFTGSLRDINPYVGSTSDSIWYSWRPWSSSCDAGYRASVESGLTRFMNHARDGLRFTFQDDATPRRQFFRKVFMVGGSDAHGDFNYTLDLCSTVLSGLCTNIGWPGENTVTDSAWGRPSTYVLGGTLEDMRHGHSVVTDGPALEFEVDAEPRGQWSQTAGFTGWRDSQVALAAWLDEDTSRFNPDGQIGGDGRYDGSRSALVPYLTAASGDTDTQRVYVRTRCQNTTDFGGTVPTTLEVLVSGTAGSTAAHTTVALTAHLCDGAWHTQPLNLPAALTNSAALVAHARFGSGCPGTYDAYTNPVWLAVVRGFLPLTVQDASPSLNVSMTTTVPISMSFPVSMKRERITGRLYQVRADGSLGPMTGGTDGRGALLATPATVMGWSDSTDGNMASAALQFTIPTATPVRGTRRTDVALADERFVLVVERGDGTATDRRLRDAFDNPLGVFMVRFRPYDTCVRRTCASGFRFCNSLCRCVEATRCIGGISLGGCACCLSYSPLMPLVCTVCSPGTDVFNTNCPNG